MCHCCTCARPAHLNTPTLQPSDHSLSAVRAISESRLYLQTPNAVGAVLRCTHPNAICIPNQCRIPHAYSAGSSAETLDMDNPENLEILKILVQTDAVRFGVPFCICLLFSSFAPFSPHTVRVCHCCTCARIAHVNTPTLRYNEFLSKTPHNDFLRNNQHKTILPSFKKCIPTHLRWQISDNYTSTFNTFPIFSFNAPFCT